ncbi:MAG TPA: hypothetical protein VNL15_03640, partial [Dehalococcoidia bacterium]|nr:hypothetical protein [Dehalococcoidia bacterium]
MFAQVSQRKIFLIAAVCLIVALAAFFGTRAAISGGGGPAAPSVITTPPGSDARSSHEALKTRIAEIRQALREHPERFPDPAQ